MISGSRTYTYPTTDGNRTIGVAPPPPGAKFKAVPGHPKGVPCAWWPSYNPDDLLGVVNALNGIGRLRLSTVAWSTTDTPITQGASIIQDLPEEPETNEWGEVAL